MSDGGKGSKPRPFSISQEEYADRFDAIFGKKKMTTFTTEDRIKAEEKLELVKCRDPGMTSYTYFWKDPQNRTVSPFFNTESEAQEWMATIGSK